MDSETQSEWIMCHYYVVWWLVDIKYNYTLKHSTHADTLFTDWAHTQECCDKKGCPSIHTQKYISKKTTTQN